MTDAEKVELLAEALIQLCIGVGMGWDLEGLQAAGVKALRDTGNYPGMLPPI